MTVRPPAPPQIAAHLLLDGGPFGSAVSAAGIGWIGQPGFGQVSHLDIAAGAQQDAYGVTNTPSGAK